jgi:hypothetical protein
MAKELADLKAWKAEREKADSLTGEERRKAEQKILADKGKIEELVRGHNDELAKRESKYEELLSRTRKTELTRSLTAALAGKPLVPGAVNQLVALWSADFEVSDGADGSFSVRCGKTFRPPEIVIAERLASVEYAHFVKADSRGGTGGSGGAAGQTPDHNAAPVEYRSYEDAVMARWNAAQQARAEGPSWQRDWRQNGAKKT